MNHTVAAIIIKDKSILLEHRAIEPFKGTWTLPGGHIEPGEEAPAAIVREVQEETGLTFTGEFVGAFPEIFPEQDWTGLVHVFKGTAAGKLTRNQESTELAFVPIDDLANRNLGFDHRRIISEVL